MQIIDLADHVQKIEMQNIHDEKKDHDDDGHQHHAAHDHDHEGEDPHIWTSPSNVKIIAKNIYNALKKADPNNAEYYKKNLNIFLASVNETDRQIMGILSSLDEGEKFMVFHPSWGYFAKAYNMEQIAVEIEGKEPKPKELIHLLKEAREEKVKAIFTQPEFSDTTAKIIAKELDIPVVKVSPLASEWSENLINIAKAIAGKN